MSYAEIWGRRAVIVDPNKGTFTLEKDSPTPEKRGRDFDHSMWLMSSGASHIDNDPGDYPYTKVYEQVNK